MYTLQGLPKCNHTHARPRFIRTKPHNKTVPDATSMSNGSHPTKLPVMKSGRGSETDSEVCDDVQAGVNNQAQDKAARNMSTVQNINTRRQQEVNHAYRAYEQIKPSLWLPINRLEER